MKKKQTLPSQAENETIIESAEIHLPYIVGIGSSAGGLEALSTMVAALPCNLGIAYVVIQHLSPTHRSLMVQLLGRETALAVCEIEDGVIPEADLIYVAPAGRNVILENGHFKLLETKREAVPKPSANAFFTSLAMEKGEEAIGVILSGTGTDGTVGLREIKANGGFTFAQEPSSAKYNGMPQSAIDSGCVDWILTPDKIAEEIANIVRHRPTISIIVEQQPQSQATLLKKLLMRVKQKTRIDFGGYKEATLWRRIERRMAANHFVRFEDYLQFVEQDSDELERLSKDILISVTAFFRDPEAFERLKEVIHHIAKNKQQGDEIRIWVAACATGEEAYSVGILLAEELGENLPFYKIQIFATDIDNDAMNMARKGVYVEGALAEIPPALIARYFTQRHDRYEISRTIRDMVVFARQDLVQDPPFLRLDLISCRNVLIYLQTDLQAKILAIFHYGLRNGGFLFLGKSESIFQQETLFDVIDKQFRIFRRNNIEGKVPQTLFQMPLVNENTLVNVHKKLDAKHYLLETAIKAYIPATILVNTNLDIQHIYGDVSDFLIIPEGKPSTNLMHLLLRELRPDLQMLQHQAEKKSQFAVGRPHLIRRGENEKYIRLVVRPTENDINAAYFLISFETMPELQMREFSSIETDSNRNVSELEDELVSTRERLQTVIEELETSNEEMQALNEEVQAANEELQSSNEELESANEELQSTNEELTTVNEELQIRTTELAETLNDLECVQNCVGFPIIVVSENLKILRFNAPAASLFSMNRASVGVYLTALRLPVGMNEFSQHVQKALMQHKVVEVASPTLERHYLLHISPYNDAKGELHGAIIALVDDTERRANEREIQVSREKLLSIMNNSTAIITLKDIAGRYEFVNHQFEKVFNLKAEEILGKTDSFFLSERISDNFRVKELEVIRTSQPSESEDHIQYGDFDLYLLSIRFPLLGDDKLPYGICTQMSDITNRVKAESQLRLAARVFDRSSEGIMVTDAQQNILTVNDAFTMITGYEAKEVIGKKPEILNSKHQTPEFYEEMWDAINTRGWWQGEIWNRRKKGDVYPEWLTINAIHDNQSKIINYVGIFSDITIVKDSQKRVEFLATHDPLTGLPNRALFLDRVRHAALRGERNLDYVFAVLFVDLDDFKIVNDSLGHSAGDELLKEVAQRLKGLVRASDTIARFGGDEFALLLEDTNIEEAEITARRLCLTMAKPILLGEDKAHVSASVGIAIYPDDSKDPEILLKHADTAMYEAKSKGKSAHHFFTKELMAKADARLKMENGLRQAITNNELVLYYQPQVDVATGQIISVEALVRWHTSEKGMISPAEFIPLAEKSGLITQLGEWVANQACSQMANWLANGTKISHVSINVSPEQFKRGRIFHTLQRLLNHYHLPANHIMLEITESTLSEENSSLMTELMNLKQLGIKISIDDFGTGYSSLARIKSYPIDELKIDRSFIEGLTKSAHDKTITQTIIIMAKTLGFSVVAEGVETHEQLDILRDLSCDIIQGYFYFKPMPHDEIVKLSYF